MHNCFLLQDIWSLMNNNKVSSAVHIKKIIKFAKIWTKLSAYEKISECPTVFLCSFSSCSVCDLL